MAHYRLFIIVLGALALAAAAVGCTDPPPAAQTAPVGESQDAASLTDVTISIDINVVRSLVANLRVVDASKVKCWCCDGRRATLFLNGLSGDRQAVETGNPCGPTIPVNLVAVDGFTELATKLYELAGLKPTL